MSSGRVPCHKGHNYPFLIYTGEVLRSLAQFDLDNISVFLLPAIGHPSEFQTR